jgi:hypothetical protein
MVFILSIRFNISSINFAFPNPKLIIVCTNGKIEIHEDDDPESPNTLSSDEHTSYGKTGILVSNTSISFCIYFLNVVYFFDIAGRILLSSSLRSYEWFIILIISFL